MRVVLSLVFNALELDQCMLRQLGHVDPAVSHHALHASSGWFRVGIAGAELVQDCTSFICSLPITLPRCLFFTYKKSAY